MYHKKDSDVTEQWMVAYDAHHQVTPDFSGQRAFQALGRMSDEQFRDTLELLKKQCAYMPTTHEEDDGKREKAWKRYERIKQRAVYMRQQYLYYEAQGIISKVQK